MTSSRNTGKVRACAECRRLKLRCDRNFPCQACVRRGCSSICPDKCFTDKATPSSLKANTLRSREQIQSLEARIVALENALAQEKPSHPLISPKNSPAPLEPAGDSDELLEEAVDILGTLTIAEDGSTVFKGVTEKCPESSCYPDTARFSTGDQSNLPDNIQVLSALFPFTPQNVASAATIDDFLPFLPTAEGALDILGHYWNSFTIHMPICHSHFMKYVYNTFYPDNRVKCHLVPAESHLLGLLFITLALGALNDPNRPMLSMEAETYHQLSRAALSLNPVCENTTIPALQCMLSMSWYFKTAPNRTSYGYSWAFQGIILKLASSIWIFRDSRKWLSDPDEIAQREILCWEIICTEVWMAFFKGRPSSIDLSLVECPRPSDAVIESPGLGPYISGLNSWRYSFFSLINNVLLVVMRPKPVKYSEIVALERQLRECAMPADLEVPVHGSPLQDLPDDATTMHFQRFAALLIREMASCMLHRRFLLLAMEKASDNMHDIPFKFSALRAAHSARWVVTCHIIMYRRYPDLIARSPTYWMASFCAATVLGAIAARYADRKFACCALAAFEGIYALFAETAAVSIQPAHAVPSLQRLYKRISAHFPGSVSTLVSVPGDQCLGIKQQNLPNPEYIPEIAVPASVSPTLSGASRTSPSGSGPSSANISPSIADVGIPGDVLDPTIAAWPAFDLTYPPDDGGIHMDASKSNQEYQSSWLESIDVAALTSSITGPSIAEVGQWDQIFDQLGVWD